MKRQLGPQVSRLLILRPAPSNMRARATLRGVVLLLRIPISIGGVQIIGRNSRFMGYFVTKTKKSTEKKYQKIQG